MFKVTKQFISGILHGMTITETYSFRPTVGFICKKPCAGSSGYKILAVEEVK